MQEDEKAQRSWPAQSGERGHRRSLLPTLFRLKAALQGGPTVIPHSGCTAPPSSSQLLKFFSDKQEADGRAGSDQGHSLRSSALAAFPVLPAFHGWDHVRKPGALEIRRPARWGGG